MKVSLNAIQSVSREHPRPAAVRANAAANPTALAGAPLSANSAAPFSEPENSAKFADIGGQKTSPPGLERVLTRLQNIPLPERTAGQSNALQQVARNIARYVETQALAAPPADTPQIATPPDAEPESVSVPVTDIVT